MSAQSLAALLGTAAPLVGRVLIALVGTVLPLGLWLLVVALDERLTHEPRE